MAFFRGLVKTLTESQAFDRLAVKASLGSFGKDVVHLTRDGLPNLRFIGDEAANVAQDTIPTLTKRLEAFAEVNPRVASTLDEIGFLAHTNPSHVMGAKSVLGEGIAENSWSGLFTPTEAGRGRIWIDPMGYEAGAMDRAFSVSSRATSGVNFVDRTLTHELGHALHETSMAGGGAGIESWEVSMGENGPFLHSEYAMTDPHEFAAEAYAASIHEPQLIKGNLAKDIDYLTSHAEEVSHGFSNQRVLPNMSMNMGRRHSSARYGLPVRSSATGRFR